MGFAFDAPLALLLLVPALLLTYTLHLAARRRTGKSRRRVALLVRTLLLTALVFALAGFRLVLPVDRLATVFVVDLSDSVGETGREDALAFVRDSLKVMPQDDVAGIVAFGKGALVERLPAELREIDRIASAPVTSATDIGGALRLASALFPDDAQKRIVLLSDGNDTTGQGQAEAALAAARGIQVETKTIGLGATEEVLVERITAPSTSRLGEEIEVSADIRSTTAQPATVRLFANGVQVGEEHLDLDAGTTPVTFRVKPADAGFLRFRVVVEAALNTFSQNDRADANTIVQGEPRTLVVSGDEAVAAELVGALKTERQQVDQLPAEGLSSDPLTLAEYDSIVLVDVPRTDLTDRQMLALQVYVRDLGKGLVMVGGPHAFGAGGYEKTPIEETLPVDMGVRDREKQPDIALVVVIDKSGSMDACHCNSFNPGGGGGPGIAGVRKVDIGKEAILRAAAAMTSRDEIGVVAFDSSAHWVVHTQPLGGVGDLQGAIGGIQPLGQTNIFSGLSEAVKSLEGVTATRRHIILLTDGWSTSGQYDQILAQMKADGITLSTVGAGGGSNPFLQKLASEGGGRFYAATNPASIPDIFLKETQQVSGQQIVEETFHPIQTSSSPILRGLDQGFPQLLGYNGTTAKAAAQTVLVTARDDPLLAQWQFGLGRAVAWTSDSTGRWAKAWIGWDGFSRFFSQLVGWTFPGEETGGIEASFVTDGSTTKLRVESVAEDGSPRDFYQTAVSLTDPDLTSRAIGLAQVAPGVYEAPLGEIDAGAYVVRVSQTRPGTTPLGRTLGLVAPTPAEYRLLGSNDALLATLRSATGGRAIDLPAQPWTHDLEATDAYTDLWPLLLILALLLWPLDIALRRVSIGRREFADAGAWLRGGWRRGRRRAAPRPVEVSGMLAARDRAAGSTARAAILRGDSAADGPGSTARDERRGHGAGGVQTIGAGRGRDGSCAGRPVAQPPNRGPPPPRHRRLPRLRPPPSLRLPRPPRPPTRPTRSPGCARRRSGPGATDPAIASARPLPRAGASLTP